MKKLFFLGMLGVFVLATSLPGMPQTSDPVFVGAGDVADCASSQLSGSFATASILDAIPGSVFAAGDLAYDDGTDGNFAKCYDATWGRFRARTYPAVGNHEYQTPNAADYYDYFGPAAGDPKKGYYSFNLGAWHIVSLNSNCNQVGCDSTSTQYAWLQADLAANPATCTLAFWHHPYYSSDPGTTESVLQNFWQVLYNAGAELVLNGHAHVYERFAPQDPNGNAVANGIREFVVGTGGEAHGSLNATAAPNEEIRNNTTFGVLKLTLHASSYDWQFVPQAGGTFTDSGTQTCH